MSMTRQIKVDKPFSKKFIESWSESIHYSTGMRRSGPFFVVNDVWGKRSLVYIPFLSYTDLTSSAAISLARSVEKNSYRVRFLSSESQSKFGDPVVSRFLSANKSVESIWESLPSEVRNRVRLAKKVGLSVATVGLQTHLSDFYNFYSSAQSRLGVPLLPTHFFRSLADTCDTSLTMVLHGGKLVACALRLKDEKLAWIPWICNTREGRGLAAIDFLYWSLIGQGIEESIDIIDFGRSQSGSGVCRFKQKWGCTMVPVVTLGFQAISIYKKYAFAQKIWSKLPLSVTTNLSKKIISRMPDL